MAGLLPCHFSGASKRRAGGFGLRATLNEDLACRASRRLVQRRFSVEVASPALQHWFCCYQFFSLW
ncbi:MAG TPA: hypothetical protein PLE22_16575, partial [Acidovorax sp.]|nr:hypothetical protein [Acidovorax sp.]